MGRLVRVSFKKRRKDDKQFEEKLTKAKPEVISK